MIDAKETTEIGRNHTGIQTDMDEAQKTIDGAIEGGSSMDGGEMAISRVRSAYVEEADGVGSLPDVSQVEGLGKKVKPHKLQLLLDKLGEREAFERMGVRLYDALISKVEATGVKSGPHAAELREIRDEELMHFQLVRRSLAELGGDPTEETPCADASGVASRGVLQVVVDPRMSVAQSLSAVLTAELTDSEGWDMLIKLSRGLGFDEMADEFDEALVNERRHVEKVRGWLTRGIMSRIE